MPETDEEDKQGYIVTFKRVARTGWYGSWVFRNVGDDPTMLVPHIEEFLKTNFNVTTPVTVDALSMNGKINYGLDGEFEIRAFPRD